LLGKLRKIGTVPGGFAQAAARHDWNKGVAAVDALTVFLMMSKELHETRRSRWFLLLAVVFTGLALALSLLGSSALGAIGGAGFGRTTASLLNLVILIVPLMGLLMASLSVAGEREHGTLLTVLAQPVLLEEVLLGKFLGLAAALLGTILFGFGAAGLVIARQSGSLQAGTYLVLIGYTALFGLGYLSLGFLISALARRTASAVGVAIFLWLVCVFLGDLGLIGTAVVLQLSPRSLLWLSLVNPAQVFKLGVLEGVQRNLESLGPGGLYATRVLGDWLTPALTGLLALWAVVPFAAAVWLLRRRGVS
jgi:Cu-processing system permease protein